MVLLKALKLLQVAILARASHSVTIAEIFASDAVRDLVGRVFPYFAVKHGIGVFTFHRFADLAYKPVTQFIGDVKPEPADPLPHPFFDNTAFAADELPI